MKKRILTREELKHEDAKQSYYLEVFIVFIILNLLFGL